MKTKVFSVLGFALLAASFTFGSSLACSEAPETTSSASQTMAPGSNAKVSERLDDVSCTSYSNGETCIAISQLDVLPNSQAPEVDLASAVSEIEPSAIDAPLAVDAIAVEITQTVTIVVPGQIVEDNEEPTHTGSIAPVPSATEPISILDAEAAALGDNN